MYSSWSATDEINLVLRRVGSAFEGEDSVSLVKMAIDTVEKELKEIAFACETMPDKKTRVIKEPELVLQKFDELLVKI